MKSTKLKTSPMHLRNAYQTPDGRMEAIAWGVQARFDERTGYSRKITDETVNIARTLGVTDREIKSWVDQRIKRLARDEERLKSIKTLLDKVQSNISSMS